MKNFLIIIFASIVNYAFATSSSIFLNEIDYYYFYPIKQTKAYFPDEPLEVKKKPYDVLEYNLFLDWYNVLRNPYSMDSIDRVWNGINTISLVSKVDGLNQIELEASNLFIDSVFVDIGDGFSKILPQPKIFGQKLMINTPSKLSIGDTARVRIFYTYARNIPEENYRGFYLYPKGKYVGRLPAPFYDSVFVEERIAYTMSEPEDARYWMPCNDAPYDKANASITVRVPKDYVVASNGYLDKVVMDGDSAKVFYWISDKPITTYLMSATASKYIVFHDWYRKVTAPNDSIQIQYYVWEKDYNATKTDGSEYNAKNTLTTTPKMMEFFSRIYIEYPFVKYGMAVLMPFNFGGMEHQTITSINRVWLRQNTQFGIAHELSHQWIGDLVTCATWNDIWFNEGGATWSEALYAENLWGEWGYNLFILSSRREYLRKGGLSLPPIYGLPTNTIFGDYAVLVYQKASWVYHMLKVILGDTLFFTTFRSFLEDYSFQSITTEDLITYFKNKISNPLVDFDTFFDQWIYKAGHPVFSVNSFVHSYQNETGSYDAEIILSQVQSGNNVPDVFVTPVKIIFKKDSSYFSQVFFVDKKVNTFQTSLPFFPDSVLIDTTYILCEKGDIFLTVIESNSNIDFNFYPNPLPKNQVLYCKTKSIMDVPLQISIYDLMGNLLVTKIINPKENVNLVDIPETISLSQGQYLILVNVNGSQFHYLLQKI